MKYQPFLLLFSLVLLASSQPSANGQTFKYEVFDTDLPPNHVYKERRQRLMDLLPRHSVAAIMSAEVRNRQNDVDYEYRQNSNLLYLTGYPHPEAVLLLAPSGISLGGTLYHEVLFVSPREPKREVMKPCPSMASTQPWCSLIWSR